MTMYGTISVKTPDVWGQDRLAKFRSEYESQMAEWLRHGFKSDINASVRRSEVEATQVQIGGNLALSAPSSASASSKTADEGAGTSALSKSLAGMNAGASPPATGPEKTPVALEPTIVLDEHSNYLNHLNQLRRINAGDELADRPGYGLYLIRIPVTLSPGPRSRRGKGAIITVSAKPVMSKQTLRNALRNTVINETVMNLTQAVADEWTTRRGPNLRAGQWIVLIGGLRRHRAFLRQAKYRVCSGRRPIISSLATGTASRIIAVRGLQNGCEASSRPRTTSWNKPPRRFERPRRASRVDPLEELGNDVARRDFVRIAQMRFRRPGDPQVKKAAAQGLLEDDELGERRARVVSLLSFALQIQAAGVSRRLKKDIADQDPTLDPEYLKGLSFFEPEVSDDAFRAFEKYVNSKWPLRVYAIEPVIAQQNVADAFGRSKRSAFDLARSGTDGTVEGARRHRGRPPCGRR